ncbi:hypothetical protein [Pseudomonas indica]|uniref:hypothetical protein n=1 Tax=Pseudomonas indica TaxID=137658 RepID=UPI003FD682B4
MRSLSVVLMGMLLALGGCSFSAPGVRAELGGGDAVRVDVGGGGGHFCPPGHRMKGSC